MNKTEIWSKSNINENTNLNYQHPFVSEEVCINDTHFLDFNIGEIVGERQLNQVVHCHSKLEISMVKEGSGIYHIGDQVYDLSPGDVMIINNIEPHGIVLEKDQRLTNMVVHFEPKFVWQENNAFDLRYLKIFFNRSSNFSHKLDNNNPATPRIRQLFWELEEEFRLKEPEYLLMIKVKLLNLLVLLLRHYGYVNKHDTDEHLNELKIINQVTDYIDQHFDKEIKLKELAEIAFMNPAYFSTFFKKYNGVSPIDYIIRKRVSKAMDYLSSTDKTILEISGLCGFNNSANFNKMFKKITSMTPTEFKKSKDYRYH